MICKLTGQGVLSSQQTPKNLKTFIGETGEMLESFMKKRFIDHN